MVDEPFEDAVAVVEDSAVSGEPGSVAECKLAFLAGRGRRVGWAAHEIEATPAVSHRPVRREW